MHRIHSVRRVLIPSLFIPVFVAALLVLAGLPAYAQGEGRRMGRGMMAHDATHDQDMTIIHGLLDHGSAVRRTVTNRPDGVETLTESDDPEIANNIKAHVGAMYVRVKDQKPIHMRDPLFREVFAHAKQITLKHELTEKGVKVIETSDDPYVVSLIQKHAEVVSAFIRNGRREAMTNHEVPPQK